MEQGLTHVVALPGNAAAAKPGGGAAGRRWREVAWGHLRRCGLTALNLLLMRGAVLRLVGLLNRRWGFLHTVFVAYPAGPAFADAYSYPQQREGIRWRPWLCGVFRQGGRWGMITAVSSTDEDFLDPGNEDNLRALFRRAEHLRRQLHAPRKTFAGILPGLLCGRRIVRQCPEADLTVDALCQAEAAVRRELGYPDDAPLIVIGGRGFIGRRLVRRFRDRPVYSVDVNGKGGEAQRWPDHLRGTPAILINAARPGALQEYLPRFWPGLALVNEVYPAPGDDDLAILRTVGAPAFHVVGVEAASFPPFPGEYRGGIPCCAAMPQDGLQVLLRRLC